MAQWAPPKYAPVNDVTYHKMGLHGPLFAYFEYFRHEILAKVGKFYGKYIDTYLMKKCTIFLV